MKTSNGNIPSEISLDEHMIVKLLKAVNTTSDAIFLTNSEGIFNYVNSGFSTLYGYTADTEVKGEIQNKTKSGEAPKANPVGGLN